jgi:hypothetical protein
VKWRFSAVDRAVVAYRSRSGHAVVVRWRAKVSDEQEGAATTGLAKGRANLKPWEKASPTTRPAGRKTSPGSATLDPSWGVGEERLQKGPHSFNKLIHQRSSNQLTLLLNRPKITVPWAAALHTYEGGIAQAICLSQGHRFAMSIS